VTINYENGTIWFNGVDQFLGDTSAFFAAFEAGGSKHLTLGSVVGNQVGWSADDLVLATDIPPPANSPAVIGGNVAGNVQEDTPLSTTATGLLTIDDADGAAEEVFIAQVNTQGIYGTFSVDAAGNWTYVIDNALLATQGLITGQTEQDKFTVVSADGTEVDVTIDVAGLDEPPPAATLPDPFTGTGDATDDDGPGATDSVDFDPNGAGSANEVTGTDGPDLVNANNNNDTVYGYDGNDRLNGQDGNDEVYGQLGADTITGGINDDKLFGGSGADSIVGNDGADTLTGGFGADTLTGSGGTDRFVFTSVNDRNDIITDFDSAEVLDFSAFGGLTLLATESAGFTANNQVAWFKSGGDTVVIVNTDGNNATAEFMVTLQGYTTDMVQNDFVFGT
jgi:VCBS repeat-containing protein